MDVNPIDIAKKTDTSAKKPPPAQASSPQNSNPTVSSPNPKDDFVTLSREAKLSVERADSASSSGSAPVSGGTITTPSGSVEVNPQRKLSVTEDQQVILKIIDPKTKDVIKQVPAEEQVKIRQATRNLVDKFLPPQ